MSRTTDTRKARYSILLICEGARTEPNFFYELKEDSDKCAIPDQVKILPKPALEDVDFNIQPDRGRSRRLRRQVNNYTEKQQNIEKSNLFPGEQPLNWVKAAHESLNVYDEVWCLFDKDEHPKQKEAFELAAQIVEQGGNLHIAFSSRCIEYYFLLHFEYLFRCFEKSECNEKLYSSSGRSKTVYFHCMTDRAVKNKACDGSRCINGYARSKGYWQESKTNESVYRLLSDKLLIGLRNAAALRKESDSSPQGGWPIYERNPYVNTDYLVARLMGYTLLEDNTNIVINDSGTDLHLFKDGVYLTIENNGDVAYLLKENCLSVLDINSGQKISFYGERKLILPKESHSMPVLQDSKNAHVLSLASINYMFFVPESGGML